MSAALATPAGKHPPGAVPGRWRVLLPGLLAAVVFLAYGSLVPLDFRALGWEEALGRFLALELGPPTLASRTDVATNVLLGVPLGFFALGLLGGGSRLAPRLVGSVLTLALCLAASVAVEFAQLFVPARSPSLGDITAQLAGAVLGIGAWWWRGPAAVDWVRAWREARGVTSLAERLLWSYVAVLFGYGLLPLDLTISPVELYHKWQAGRVVLIPFTVGADDPVERLYQLGTDVALWLPVSLLWVLSARRRPAEAWAWAVLAALVLEVLQLLVYSRVTDLTDVLLAGAGAGLGAWIGARWRPGSGTAAAAPGPSARNRILALGGALAWTLLLSAVFWYPFDFQLERAFLRERLPLLGGVPLLSYYHSTEFRAVTELLHKLVFFAPLGVLLALARAGLRGHVARRVADAAAILAVAAVALGIELGQVALPGKYPGSTDWFLETLGGVLGYAGTLWLAARLAPGTAAGADPAPAPPPAAVKLPPEAAPTPGTASAGAPGRPWLALAVTALGWVSYAALTPFAPLPLAGEDPLRLVATGLGAFFGVPDGVDLLMGLYTWAVLGFLWQGAARRHDGALRWGAAMAWAVPCVLLLVALVLALARTFLLTTGASPAMLLTAVPGLVLGSVAWAPLGRRAEPGLGRLTARLATLTRPALAAAVLLPVLLPPDAGAGIAGLGGGWGVGPMDLLQGIPGQIYHAFKSIMLWVPVGLVLGLGDRGQEARVWILAGVATFVAVGLPWLEGLALTEGLEVLFAPVGVWAGTWIARGLAATGEAATGAGTAAAAVAHPDETPGSAAAEPHVPPVTGPMPVPACPDSMRPSRGRRGAAGALLALALGAALDYPAFAPWLAVGLAAYAAVLWRWPRAWLVVVPAALPLLDFAPWAGLTLFDGFDLLMVVTAAMAVWHPATASAPFTLAPAVRGWLVLFTVSWFVALLIALLPLAPLDANATGSYWSPYHALRVGKGLAWALVIAAVLRRTVADPMAALKGPFATGMAVGLAGVIAVGLRERWQFGGGLLDLDSTYRITATFSTMHTGGSHIEAYLVAALPFLWLLMGRGRNPLLAAGAVALFLIGAFLTTLTVARGGVLGLVVGLAVLAVGMLRVAWTGAAPPWKRLALPAVLLAATAGVLAVGVQGGYFQERLARVERDLDTRLTHWRTALALREPGWVGGLLGTGLGTFPRVYLLGAPVDTPPGTFRYEHEGDEAFLRLGSGETLYLAQRVAARPHTRYTLSLAVRSRDPGARLSAPLCEKHLLNSHDCRWQGVPFEPGDGSWQRVAIIVDTGELGAGNWLTRRPTELSLYNPARGTVVDIDDVRLVAGDGTSLLANGDFSAGGEHWLFKTHDHLPYHVKNQPLALLFEQGWLGLVALAALALAVLARLAPGLWRGDPGATALAASVTAFLAVGAFSSPLDAPRIATLFYTVLILGGLRVRTADPRRRRPGEASRHA